MDILDSFILGLVQGLAEYLPISSSGHLEIFREILGLDLGGAESLQFDVMLHVATVLSTIVVLWHEFSDLIVGFFTFNTKDPRFIYVCKILVSCIPIGIVGVFFKDYIEQFFGQELTLVGVCLCITAALLAFSYFFRTRPLEKDKITGKVYKPRDITFSDAFIIGCSQAVAVLPGLSRSGTTIATGILIGDKREQVAQFSFLMVIIPILGEALLDIKDMFGVEAADAAAGAATPEVGTAAILVGFLTSFIVVINPILGEALLDIMDMFGVEAADAAAGAATPEVGTAAILVGFLTSFIVGCIACKWMLSLVKKGKLVWFALYCLAAGILCITVG